MKAIVLRMYRTSLGKKVVMASTGFVLFGFVFAHLLGNLQVFAGADTFNAYAAFLKANPPMVWSMRLLLLMTVGMHMGTAALLTLQAWRGRPRRYVRKRYLEAPLTSRSMRYTGVLILLFVVYHLLHLTTGTLHAEFSHVDVFGNVIVAFSSALAGAAYIAAVLGLGLHLSHGLRSMLQSVGANTRGADGTVRLAAMAVGLFLVMGFLSIPLAVALGLFN